MQSGILILVKEENKPLYIHIEEAIRIFKTKTGQLPTACEVSTEEEFIPDPGDIRCAELKCVRPSKTLRAGQIMLGPVP